MSRIVVTRKKGESIKIGTNVVVTVESIKKSKVLVSIEAPKTVKVLRGELHLYKKVYCSECCRCYGPGDHGFSHCEDHAHLTAVAD